jgi:Flp pilus assembly protein TadG
MRWPARDRLETPGVAVSGGPHCAVPGELERRIRPGEEEALTAGPAILARAPGYLLKLRPKGHGVTLTRTTFIKGVNRAFAPAMSRHKGDRASLRGQRMALRRHGIDRARDERGAVAVEFAILVPLLFALLFGIITAGIGYNNTLGLADGVREGSRFGATTLASPGWGATVKAQVMSLTNLSLADLPAKNVCAKLIQAPSTLVWGSTCSTTATDAGPEPATPADVPVGTCVVKVWARIDVPLTFVIAPTKKISVQRKSVSLYERACS